MAENSHIEWCDHTFNPWMGCTKVSPGCAHCYAETLMDHRYGKVLWGPQGERKRTSEQMWKKPLQWNKVQWQQCSDCGWRGPVSETHVDCPNCDGEALIPARQRVFCASLADVFEDNPQLADWREELFKLIEQTPNLDWLILTKRPELIFSLGTGAVGEIFDNWLMRNNVWLGTSIENQKTANERIPHLLKMCAKVHFLSCEPMLSYIDLSKAVKPDNEAWDEVNAEWDDYDEPEEFVEECEAELDWINYGNDLVSNPEHREWSEMRRRRAGFKTLTHGVIDWVICGGESGPQARPMHPAWVQSLRNECNAAGVAFFFKQWGEWVPLAEDFDSTSIANVEEFDTTKKYWQWSEHGYYDPRVSVRVGKKAAGRMLDGREWNEWPEDK